MSLYALFYASGRLCCLRRGLLVLGLCTLGHLAGAQDDEIDLNPAGIQLQRLHPDDFVGGTEILVTVNIVAASDTALFALGLYETPPSGWTFEGLYVDEGPQPDILPPLGATGVLEFGWVSPAVPVTMRYALRIPVADRGAHFLSGQVEYRLASDPKRNSAPLITQIDGVADEAPVVTLLGDNPLPWKLGTPFSDPGATATDKEDGDVSASVQSTGTVDVNEVGTYTLVYGVLDSVGNRANPVSRTVVVSDEDTPDPTNPGNPNSGGTDGSGAGGSGPSGRGPMAGTGSRSNSTDSAPRIARSGVVPQVSIAGNRPTHLLPKGSDPSAPDATSAPGGGGSEDIDGVSGALQGSSPGGGGGGEAPSAAAVGEKDRATGSRTPKILAGFFIALAGMSVGALIAWRRSYGAPRRRIRRHH